MIFTHDDDNFVFTVDDTVQMVGVTELLMAVTETPGKDLKAEFFVYPFEAKDAI